MRSNVTEIPAAPSAEARDEFTRHYLVQLLHLTQGRVSEAARLAQRNRTEFYKLLSRYEIDLERFKSTSSPNGDA
jgi:two-component system response regulator GlrR